MNPDRDLEIDAAKFEFLWPLAYPDLAKNQDTTTLLKKLVDDDIIQFGQLFEKAIERQLKLVRESTVHKDFQNGEDAKCVVVRTHSSDTAYGANVPNIHSKTGSLLISVYERKQKKWYFFRIPNHAYCHISKSSNIEIPFKLDGTPKKTNHWWQWSCDSFENLSKPWPVESTEIKKKDSILIDDILNLKNSISLNSRSGNNFFNQLFEFDE
jgi:hypothetical protein